MRCSVCDHENPDQDKFCGNCGNPLSPDVGLQPADPSPPKWQPAEPSLPAPQLPAYPSQPLPYPLRPPKDRSLAVILEILPGFFGFLGIGWLYSGNTGAGLGWLIGVLVWDVIAITVVVLTLGIGVFCVWPVNIALLAISAITLNNYTRQHPELFGP